MASEKDLLDLVALSYAATDEGRWLPFLQALASVVHASRPILFEQRVDVSASTPTSIVSADGYDERAIVDYRQYYAGRNVWLANGTRFVRPGVVRTSEMMCRRDVLLESEFYNDFLRPLRISHALAGTLAVEDSLAFNLTVFRGPGEPEFDDDDLDLLRALMPHLRQAVAIGRRMENLEARAGWCEASLDRLSIAVILVDSRGAILFANLAARRLLDAGDGIGVERGVVRASNPALTTTVRGLIDRAAGRGGECGVRCGGATTLPRRNGTRALDLVVSPLSASSGGAVHPKAAAVLLLRDLDRRVRGLAASFGRLYGLTPAESRVAERLAEGMSVQDIAASAGKSLETVRTQVKQVLAKTGTSRQSQLVGLLLRTTASDLEG